MQKQNREFVHEYVGDVDETGLRTGYGEEQWHYEYYQRYKGGFLRDSLHGRGKYCWTLGNNNTIYEGMFYTNNLEGYGKFSYDGTTVFEGLFKDNIRFGPGVFTYSDESQDVGIWNGKDLVRLSCVVLPEWVPRIARTPSAKMRLLKFRSLVSVCDSPKDRAKEILEKLEADEDVMKRSDELYNASIKNTQSHFFNKRLYDASYFCDKNCYIDVALKPSEEGKLLNRKNNDLTSELATETEPSEESVFNSNHKCICEEQRQVRITEIESELNYTEAVLKRIQVETKKAACLRRMAITKLKMEQVQNERPSETLLDTVAEAGDTLDLKTLYINTLENEEGELDLKELQDTDYAIEEVDYKTACEMLDAAKSAEKLLLRKQGDLINKLAYETKPHEDAEEEEESKQFPSKKVLITDILAWNNEELFLDVLKHVFLHRNFEKYISFCICDLLAGSRSEFRKAGVYEQNCIRFLKECSNGENRRVIDLFQCYDLNPDLCDAKGNTGIIYAAARDKTTTIRTLVNIGANVDILNDECFTSLGMCIARYLAVQENVVDWENAFLKATLLECNDQREIQEWRPHISLTSINNIISSGLEITKPNFSDGGVGFEGQISSTELEGFSELFGSCLEIMHTEVYDDLQQKLRRLKTISRHDFQEAYTIKISNDISQTYVLNTDAVKPPPKVKSDEKEKPAKQPKEAKSSKAAKKTTKSSTTSKSLKKKEKIKSEVINKVGNIEAPEPTPEEILRANKLNGIYETILTLLNCGASPNACEVPMPPLILSVFTKNQNIIENLLLCNANPNITTIDEKLTALHVVVSLPPCEKNVQTLILLLKQSANPNLRADIFHWYQEKVDLLANRILANEDKGKTPLHLLSMRFDFILDNNGYLNQMAQLFVQHGARTTLKYLGHTPLSLAMVRSNTELVRAFLETKKVNPNQNLGEEMGTPLTLYILKRYKTILPNFETCEKIIRLLIEFKANPLNVTKERGNLIDFMIKEHEVSSEFANKKVKAKLSKPKKAQSKKGKGKLKVEVQEEVTKLLRDLTRTTLEKHIQGYALNYLYFFVEEEDFYDNISKNMAKFVTPDEAVRIAQLLFYRGKIPVKKSNYKVMYDLLEFIINVHYKSGQGETSSNETNIDKMLESFEYKAISKIEGELNLPEPEAETHSDKYIVCFNCLRKKGQQLFVCPDCLLVYFCSDQCNQLSNQQQNTLHRCNTYFYSKQKEIYDERVERGKHWKRTSLARKDLEDKGWGECLGKHLKPTAEPDESRRLHLTRARRKKPAKKGLDLKVQKPLEPQDSLLSLRWWLEGSEFLIGKHEKRRSRRKGSGSDDGETGWEHSDTEREYSDTDREYSDSDWEYGGKAGKSGKRHEVKDKKGKDKSGKDKQHKGKATPGEKKHKGKSSPEKESSGSTEQSGRKREKEKLSHKKKKHKGRSSPDKESSDGTEKSGRKRGKEKLLSPGKKKHTRKSSIGRGESRIREEHLGKLSKDKKLQPGTKIESKSLAKSGIHAVQQRVEGLGGLGGFANMRLGIGGYGGASGDAPLFSGGRLMELKRRLPKRYRCFLERITAQWPEFDLSLLFLPYACFKDGQLYYKFFAKLPVFMETYSDI